MAVTKPKAEAPTAPLNTKLPRQDRGSVKLFENARRVLTTKAAPHATQDDVRTFDYWANAAENMMRHDIIYILSDDESWEIEARVERSVPGAGAEISITKVIARKGIVQNMTMLGPDHHTEFRPGQGWCVVRVKDKYPIITGCANEDVARIRWAQSQPRPVPQW